MRPYEIKAGDVLELDGVRLYLREVDHSVLSKNLGYLVCDLDDYIAHGDDAASSRWIPKTTKGLRWLAGNLRVPSIEQRNALEDGASALRYRAERLQGMNHPQTPEISAKVGEFRANAKILDEMSKDIS